MTVEPLLTAAVTAAVSSARVTVPHFTDRVAEAQRIVDPELLRNCRVLALAIATAWRWDRRDQLPDGRSLGVEWLNRLRADLPHRRAS